MHPEGKSPTRLKVYGWSDAHDDQLRQLVTNILDRERWGLSAVAKEMGLSNPNILRNFLTLDKSVKQVTRQRIIDFVNKHLDGKHLK